MGRNVKGHGGRLWLRGWGAIKGWDAVKGAGRLVAVKGVGWAGHGLGGGLCLALPRATAGCE